MRGDMKEQYISLKEATAKLGVALGTLRYYLDHLEIEKKRFPLDRRSYIKLEDFERKALLLDLQVIQVVAQGATSDTQFCRCLLERNVLFFHITSSSAIA